MNIRPCLSSSATWTDQEHQNKTVLHAGQPRLTSEQFTEYQPCIRKLCFSATLDLSIHNSILLKSERFFGPLWLIIVQQDLTDSTSSRAYVYILEQHVQSRCSVQLQYKLEYKVFLWSATLSYQYELIVYASYGVLSQNELELMIQSSVKSLNLPTHMSQSSMWALYNSTELEQFMPRHCTVRPTGH